MGVGGGSLLPGGGWGGQADEQLHETGCASYGGVWPSLLPSGTTKGGHVMLHGNAASAQGKSANRPMHGHAEGMLCTLRMLCSVQGLPRRLLVPAVQLVGEGVPEADVPGAGYWSDGPDVSPQGWGPGEQRGQGTGVGLQAVLDRRGSWWV